MTIKDVESIILNIDKALKKQVQLSFTDVLHQRYHPTSDELNIMDKAKKFIKGGEFLSYQEERVLMRVLTKSIPELGA